MTPSPFFNHLALLVRDLAPSIDFYSRVIGLESLPEPFHDGKHAWFSMGGTNQLHLIQGDQDIPDHPRNHHFCLSTTTMDSFLERLKEEGIVYQDLAGHPFTINHRPDGIRQVYFRDPDGYWIELNDEVLK
jgi:lactoylglutathione lyase